jgi:glycerol uptake facilitator-like aquaporin
MNCARLVAIALAHGLAICFLAGATGAISGGHLNPAVTLAFVVAGKETLIRAGLYVCAQVTIFTHPSQRNSISRSSKTTGLSKSTGSLMENFFSLSMTRFFLLLN